MQITHMILSITAVAENVTFFPLVYTLKSHLALFVATLKLRNLSLQIQEMLIALCGKTPAFQRSTDGAARILAM